MAGRIQVLDENLINKIAAGEVVERPASVVKELVENSIDAGATRIRVSMRGGGKQSIVVADDGAGMDREDIGLCVHRHATSKMSSASDLFQINTLGFRGEALASIGAVSHLSIESRAAGADEGTRLVIEGGIEREVHGIGRAQGTTITVRNLFFNTPARRKFLRHNDTEARHVSQMVVHLAAGHPKIGFELEHQDKGLLNFAPADRRQRAAEILAIGSEDLVDVDEGDEDESGLRVFGILAKPERCDRSKGKQYLVVRGRPIHARSMVDAVYRGFGGLLPEGRHPVFMLWIDIDPRRIDVNVHPTKREIRLADESHVAAVIEDGVRHGLRLPDAKSFIYDQKATGFQATQVGEAPPLEFNPSASIALGAERPSGEPATTAQKPADQLALSLVAPATPPMAASSGSDDADVLRESGQLWQVHQQYIIAQIPDGLMLIDQQAADERVKFARAMAQLDGVASESQQLLFPLKLEMGAADFAVYTELRDEIIRLGFAIREFGERTVLVEAIPVDLEGWGEGESFYQLLNDAREGQAAGRSWRDAVVLAYVRKTSIAKGQKLSVSEMEALIDQLLNTAEPHISPAGKPIMAKLRLSDIDRLFRKL